MARWQGGTDTEIREIKRRLGVINGDAKAGREAAEKTVVQLAVLKTKVAVWSALGGVVGAGVVTGLIQWISTS